MMVSEAAPAAFNPTRRKHMTATVYTLIGWTGQEAYRYELSWDKALPAKEDIRFTGSIAESKKVALIKERDGIGPGDVTDVKLENGILTIDVEPISTRYDYQLVIGDTVIDKKDIPDVRTRTADDKFGRYEEGEVMYRLYTPDCTEKRPLILYLHGGGNGGTVDFRDNNKQIVTDYGPVNLAEAYPDVYIMCPMAIEAKRFPGAHPIKQTFENADSSPTGWNRTYLGKVCDIIRKMIREGEIDENRVYVTGLSMGGGGTITAMSVGAGLFAAAVPICPTMTPSTYNILSTINDPVWIASAYVDHTIYRHKYLTDAYANLIANGNKNAHITLYSPEELAKYDIAIVEDLEPTQRFSENHYSWVPTYNNEHGIMTWMLNQHK